MWTLDHWVILIILVIYLLVITLAAHRFTQLIPRVESYNPVYVFIIALIQTLFFAGLIYVFFNWILAPLVGSGANISYSTSILYFIVLFVVAICVISIMSPTRGAPLG